MKTATEIEVPFPNEASAPTSERVTKLVRELVGSGSNVRIVHGGFPIALEIAVI